MQNMGDTIRNKIVSILFHVFCFIVLLQIAGCGTVTHFSNPTGELYLGTQHNFETFDLLTEDTNHEGCFISVPPLILVVGIGATLVDIPVSLISGTLMMPRDLLIGAGQSFTVVVQDEQGIPVKGAEVCCRARREHTKRTNEHGEVRWFIDWREVDKLVIEKEGFYRTVDYSSHYPNLFRPELSHADERRIERTLRSVQSPVDMIIKAIRFRVPSEQGRYGFDLVVGDLVAPQGKGEFADFYFTSEPPDEGMEEGRCDMVFSGADNGIQRWDVCILAGTTRSDFRFPYLAPEGGYFQSKSAADEHPDILFDTHPDYYENYILRTRSETKKGPFYTKIKGFVRISTDFGEKYHHVNFKYGINTTGTKSLEHIKEEGQCRF